MNTRKQIRVVLTLAAVAMAVLAGTPLLADPIIIPIDNPGFEDPPLPDGEWDWSYADEGWGYYDNDGDQGPWNPSKSNYTDEAPEGQNVGWTNSGDAGPGGFAQVLLDPEAVLKACMTYTLTVEVGRPKTYPYGGYKIQLLAGGTPHTYGTGYTGPVIGGTLLAEDDNSLTLVMGDFITSTVTYTYNSALHSHLLGEPLQIRLLALGSGDDETDFDDVRLTAILDPNAPSVYAGDDMVTWSGREVQLDPNVVNNDTEVPQRPLSYFWSAEPVDGVVFDPNEFVEAPAVTITKATTNPSAVTLTLAVTLEGKDPVTDTMMIDVYDDACEAAKGVGTVELDPTDLDEDCDTDLADFAELAATWLVDYTLTAPVPKEE